MEIIVQVRDLLSSNLNSMVGAASNPVKMLSLFQHQLQEYVIALQGDHTRATRRAERLTEQAAKLDRAAAEWTSKAQTAMNHKREDLARSALLTREQTAAEADAARAEAEAAAVEAEELAQAIAELEAKLAETNARLAEECARPRESAASASGHTSRSERVLDRVATLGQRIGFATEQKLKPTPAALDLEIERLSREAKVSEELAAMKAAARQPAAKRRKAKA